VRCRTSPTLPVTPFSGLFPYYTALWTASFIVILPTRMHATISAPHANGLPRTYRRFLTRLHAFSLPVSVGSPTAYTFAGSNGTRFPCGCPFGWNVFFGSGPARDLHRLVSSFRMLDMPPHTTTYPQLLPAPLATDYGCATCLTPRGCPHGRDFSLPLRWRHTSTPCRTRRLLHLSHACTPYTTTPPRHTSAAEPALPTCPPTLPATDELDWTGRQGLRLLPTTGLVVVVAVTFLLDLT